MSESFQSGYEETLIDALHIITQKGGLNEFLPFWKCPVHAVHEMHHDIFFQSRDLLNYYETFVTNASAESLNSDIEGFRAELHGISNLPFFFYRVCKIYG